MKPSRFGSMPSAPCSLALFTFAHVLKTQPCRCAYLFLGWASVWCIRFTGVFPKSNGSTVFCWQIGVFWRMGCFKATVWQQHVSWQSMLCQAQCHCHSISVAVFLASWSKAFLSQCGPVLNEQGVRWWTGHRTKHVSSRRKLTALSIAK
eukprot:1147004-Pelagomonas_calceolata.AAC.7